VHSAQAPTSQPSGCGVKVVKDMKKKRLSKVCRGLGITSPEGIRILGLYGRKIVRKPNTKLSRLERVVIHFHVLVFK
jgi:hypothetical protein